ncbi:MAG: FAD-dependent monooxygenase [Actinomycetota bacterium]|jgi:putative polyketide hydroxylase
MPTVGDQIERHDVVVVGAGPAGLTAAITLARQGVDCLVVERRAELSALPRATTVSLRTMERLRSWGIEAEVRAGGDDVELLLWDCETLASAAAGTAVDVGYPTRAQSAVLSPTSPASVPQDHLESVLVGYLSRFPSVGVELGAVVATVEPVAGASRLVLSSGRILEAQYVIAADGAHSAVRSSLGIPLDGSDRLADGLSVQFRAPLWDVVGRHRYCIYNVTGATVPCVLVPAGDGDRWVCGIEWNPEAERLTDYGPERLTDIIRRATGVPSLAPWLERIGTFSFAAQIARRFRHGDVFLVGDAAHRVTPRGGTGMNTAVAGGFDLGWRLAWVLNGWAAPTLLDGYERERRPLAEHNVARSAAPDGSRRDALNETHVDLGGRIVHHWVETPAGPVSTLDLIGEGLTLFTGPDGDPWRRAVGAVPGGPPVTVHRLDRVAARALGIIGPGGAVLVRPDGVPVAGWSNPHRAPARLRPETALLSSPGGR